jgi:membrane protein YdbS with pleckstrin-like domain
MQSSELYKKSIQEYGDLVRERTKTISRLWGILEIAIALIFSLIATLTSHFFTTVSAEKNLSSAIWISIEIVAAAAVVLVILVSILKREPSKAVQLKKKLVASYVGPLSDSVQELQ